MSQRTVRRVASGAVALALAGILFIVYEAAAPRADETTMAGAQAWSQPAWVAAHVAAIVAFILYTLGLLVLHHALRNTPAERSAFLAVVAAVIGAGLTLPYYGAETYGLYALGSHITAVHDESMLSLAEDFRLDPTAAATFLIGLILLAVAAALTAVAVRRSGIMSRWSATPLAVAFALFLPHFFAPKPARVAYGMLLAAGLAWLAWEMWKHRAALSGEAS